MTPDLLRIIARLKQDMADHAQAAMLQPKPDPYFHGQQVGTYHGVLHALNVIDEIMAEDNEQE